MAVPPLSSTGLDTSDRTTIGAGNVGFGAAMTAPSSMGARDGLEAAEIDPADFGALPAEAADDGDEDASLTAERALTLLRDASSQSRQFFQTNVHQPWDRSYRAVRNEHYRDSIYLSDAYKTRSKLFKPKTRTALMKRLASTTKAMFASSDVVSIQAEDDSNPAEVVSASLKQEIINYRLHTTSNRNGIRWFQTAMGARYDASVTGLCVSKQTWIFKERRVGGATAMGGPNDVLIDRPEICLIPPENVRFDPNCNWTNIAQHSPYLLVLYPMNPGDALDFIRQNSHSKTPWIEGITEEMLRNYAGTDPAETQSPRTARDGRVDPQRQASGMFRNVWLTECFVRVEGVDWTFWSLGDTMLLSAPAKTEDLYPHLSGERPYVIGTDQIEPHRAYVMSAVESWQPLQQEANDLTNLRLDYEKRIVSPPTKVARGRKVDLQQVQRRGPNGIILVENMDDVMPMEMPEVPGSLFQEQTFVNADFDDLAGVFNASSVQTNRDMNETVGGMHLLAENGNQLSDLDLTVWNETWVTPVIAQLLKLEEFYESDEKVLTICGERAQLWQKFGVNAITDEMLRSDSTVRVNIGVGSTSLPLERIKKFDMAWDTAAKALAPFVQTGKIDVTPNAESIVDDIFQAAGFRDGGKRFFEYVGPPQQQPQPPQDPKAQAAMMAAQAKMQANQITERKMQAEAMLKAHELNDKRMQAYLALHNDAADRQASLSIEHMRMQSEMAKTHAMLVQEAAMKGMDHAHAHATAQVTPFLTALGQHLAPKPPMASAPNGPGTGGGGPKPNSPHGDPSKPMMAPMPSPHLQPQPGMFATLGTPEIRK